MTNDNTWHAYWERSNKGSFASLFHLIWLHFILTECGVSCRPSLRPITQDGATGTSFLTSDWSQPRRTGSLHSAPSSAEMRSDETRWVMWTLLKDFDRKQRKSIERVWAGPTVWLTGGIRPEMWTDAGKATAAEHLREIDWTGRHRWDIERQIVSSALAAIIEWIELWVVRPLFQLGYSRLRLQLYRPTCATCILGTVN